jgi:hypothetical protein
MGITHPSRIRTHSSTADNDCAAMRGHQSLIYENGCTCKGKITMGKEASKDAA